MNMRSDGDAAAPDTAASDADEAGWAERVAEASSDYEAIDPEALAGLCCDRW